MEYKKFTVEEKQAFAAEYAAGAILKDIAVKAGVSIPTMAKYIRTGGGTLRKPGIAKPEPQVKVEASESRALSDFTFMKENIQYPTEPKPLEPAAPAARTILAFE